jgi:hypothetical protein
MSNLILCDKEPFMQTQNIPMQILSALVAGAIFMVVCTLAILPSFNRAYEDHRARLIAFLLRAGAHFVNHNFKDSPVKVENIKWKLAESEQV